MENDPSPDVIVITGDADGEVDTAAAIEDLGGGAEQADAANNEEPAPFTKRKRKKTSEVWNYFRVITVGGIDMCECMYCGSEYPTSNLFLSELFGIKEALDAAALDGSDYMKEMAIKMKKKFDKYWGTSNLLISIGAVMDPRYKMKLIDFSFKGIYSNKEAPVQIQIVRDTLYSLYKEYVDAHKSSVVSSSSNGTNNDAPASGRGFASLNERLGKGIKTGTAKYDQHIRSVDSFNALKSELDTYLEEGVYIGEPGVYFDALGWWKSNNLKFRILSKMAADILAIPVTTVASESAFSAGGRVIDPHRSSLGTKMVDMLICGADWYRHYYGLEKKKNKKNQDLVYIELET